MDESQIEESHSQQLIEPFDLDFQDGFSKLREANRADLRRKMQPQSGWQVSIDPSYGNKMAEYEVAALIINRMIGTGIFETPSHVFKDARSIGSGLVIWLVGCLATLCGSLVYIEYGLTIPRVALEEGGDGCVPSNGGDLNYIQYLIPKPSSFAAFLFGIPFILLGNSAANSIAFAHSLLDLIGVDHPPKHIVLIAISVLGLVCLMHAFYRNFGIQVNNIFALVKVAFLLIIIVSSSVVRARRLLKEHTYNQGTVGCASYQTNMNMTPNNFQNSFNTLRNTTNQEGNPLTPYLQIIFSFSGYNQANCVLSEVRNPHSIFRRASLGTVTLICILYMLVNVAFLAVVQVKDDDDYFLGDCDGTKDWNVAREFFHLTFGTKALYDCVLMISSFGNIIVTTFTSARVKQEIAKAGVPPFREKVARDYDAIESFKQWLGAARRGNVKHRTPAVALALHFTFSVVIILALMPIIGDRGDAYKALTSMHGYTINAFFATCLGLGILWLRITKRKTKGKSWAQISATKSVAVSIVSAVGITLANGLPLIAAWVKRSKPVDYVGPAGALGVLLLGVATWVLFRAFWPRRTCTVEREPVVVQRGDIPVKIFDTIRFRWGLTAPTPLDDDIDLRQ